MGKLELLGGIPKRELGNEENLLNSALSDRVLIEMRVLKGNNSVIGVVDSGYELITESPKNWFGIS
jgi:hypothetical protein